jgi:TRAP-type C4-dicarboxylate transport system substrate-binding protein
MRVLVRPIVFCLAATLIVGTASAAELEVKMATLSPENSPWDRILQEMGAQWQEATAGRVGLTVYPGGVAGDEPDILRKLRIGQYHAAALSVSGLVDIDESFTVFEVPLFYRDFDEMRFVLEELTPTLSERLREKGFVLLGWGYVGWVYFFTTERAQSVAEMKELKIFTWAGDEAMVQWWRRNGFKPVSIAATDISTALQTGMIDAISVPPLYAMQVQFFKQAPYMADIGLAPMMGAILISERAWNRIAESDRPALLEAGREAQRKVFETIPKLDATAIQLMSSQGLEVVEIEGTPSAQEWKVEAEKFAEAMRGDIVPVQIFDEAAAARKRWRERAPETGGEEER